MKLSIRGSRALLVAVIVLAAGRESIAQTAKLGVFDAQRVSEETALGRRVQSELAAFRERKQTEIKDKQQAIAENERQLSQQALSLSAERRAELEKRIQSQLLELQAAQESASRQMQLEFQAASNGFQEKLQTVVSTFGKEESFTLILDRGLVAWSTDAIDVTTTIVDLFDRMFPVEAAAAKPGDNPAPAPPTAPPGK